MLFNTKPMNSALVAMVTLSIAVSASLDPIEQHLASRDSTPFQQSKEPAGKLATPVNLGNTPVSPQAVLKLTGDDLHSNAPPATSSLFGASAIVAPAQSPPAKQVEDAEDKSHCHLGHASASIKRIRYTMTVKVDQDESGDTTVAKAESVHGVVVKATSGLYSKPNPDEGSCAKTLARHGEVCANRPYIVPSSLLPAGGSAAPGAGAGGEQPKPDPKQAVYGSAAPGAGAGGEQPKPDPKQAVYHAGPVVTKRSEADPEWQKVDEAKHVVFKRDTPAPPKPEYRTDVTVAGADATITGPAGTICIDTVKRDKEVTKVVPTKATPKKDLQTGAEPLHFELVRSDDKQGVWNQIIYNAKGEPIDVTHLSLTEDMSFFRAEYGCKGCAKGHQKHTVTYEHVEIEVDALHESAQPEVVCEGNAQSTNVHKRETSRYAKKNGSGVEYKGAIFSIDRVTLGAFDSKGNGAVGAVTVGQVAPIQGPPATGKPSVEDSKDAKKLGSNGDEHTQAHLQRRDDGDMDGEDEGPTYPPNEGRNPHKKSSLRRRDDGDMDGEDEGPTYPPNEGRNPHKKRDVAVEDDGPIF